MSKTFPLDVVDLPSLRNEFLRRLGRNLWCYQQVEAQLKALLTVGQGAFPLRDGDAVLAKHQAMIRTRTLGRLVGDAADSVLCQDGRTVDSPTDWLAWSIRFDAGADFSDELHQQLQALVAERNVLVHHAAERWDFDSEASLSSGLIDLNTQRDLIESVHDSLRRVLLGVQEASVAMLAYMESSEFAQQLREAHLGACLVDAVERAARADGWTRLSEAGQVFREHVDRLPDAQRKGLPKLSRLLIDSGLFEIRDEPVTGGGGVRTMCRLRPTAATSDGFVPLASVQGPQRSPLGPRGLPSGDGGAFVPDVDGTPR